MEYVHGGDIYTYGDVLDFSVNVNPYGPSEEVLEAAKRSMDEVSLYPDSQCRRLRKRLAEKKSLPEEYFLFGNGAAELFFSVVLAEKPKKALLPIPAFAEYEQALRTVDCEIIYHELKRENNFALTESFLEELTEDIDLVFLCSPSNPSGQVIEPKLMEQILTRCEEKKIRLVLDECFIEFLEEEQKYTMVKKVTDHPSLFLVQAFTKMYGIPGLRLGYAMTSDARLRESMQQIRQPWSVEYDLTGLEKLVEEVLPLAPEQTPLQEIGQIEYTSKKTDPAYEAKRKSLEAYGYDILPDTTKQDGMEIHFQATVGADAKGTINAETYDPEAGNYSIFSWSEGNGIELATIENYLAIENRTDEYGVPAGSVKESFMEKLQTLKDQMKETTLLEETAEDEAEKILKDLNLENMQLLSSDKILWYAQSDYPEATILEQQEALWNADPNLGKTGYRLTYVPSVSGLKINQDKTGGYSDDSGFAYAPSMPVEQIYIVVTEDGIRSFKWKGMSQEEKIVTENVKLLAFDEIENRLIDQVKYLYPSSQPAESKTIFGYDVATVELGYTYIPAYKNPQNAWLVPAWFFTISESQDATAELGTAGRKIEGYQTDYIVLNATDGGRIGSYWR